MNINDAPEITVAARSTSRDNSNSQIEVRFPNEEEGEDPRTLNFAFTGEGIIVDGYCGDEPIDSFARTYEEFYDEFVLNGPGMDAHLRAQGIDPPRSKVAALSADLRLLVESDDDYVDDAQTTMCATDLLDAIDALISGGWR